MADVDPVAPAATTEPAAPPTTTAAAADAPPAAAPAPDAAPPATDAAPPAADAAPPAADAAPPAADAAPPAADAAPPAADAAPPATAAAPADPGSLVDRLRAATLGLAEDPIAAPLVSVLGRALVQAQGGEVDEGTARMLRLALSAAKHNAHLSDEQRAQLESVSQALPAI